MNEVKGPMVSIASKVSHREGFEAGQNDFKLLIESMPDYAIFMVDVEGKILTWNNGAELIYGYSPSEIIGNHLSILYGQDLPGDLEATKKVEFEIDAALTHGKFEEEGWRVRKDGTSFWTNAMVTPLRDDSGQLKGFGNVTRDLSERKQAGERYQLLVDSVKDYGIFMLDRTGIVRSWNSGAEQIKGYHANEIIGSHFSRFYTQVDIDRDHPAHELELAIKNGRFEEEGWRVRKDGSCFWANVVITPQRDESGRVTGFSKVTRDLTERMEAEKALKESEEKLRLMITSVKDYAIIMLDPQGHIVSWNQGAQRIKGWTEAEILGKSFENFYPPEDVIAGKTKYELVEAERVGSFEDYGWRVRKDGRYFWANVVITALKDSQGKLRGFSKVTRDITDRKLAEEELKKAYEELESFSYSVSHDLRAPLRSMDGFSEVLEEILGDKLDEKSRSYLGRIRESSQKMSQLIDGLLNLSHLSRTQMHREKVDLSDMARRIAADLRESDPKRELEFVIEPGLTAQADASLLRVVLENLLGNAWKYSSKNATAKIEFGCPSEKGMTTYFVKDNGVGFDMSYADKLFGAFQRLHGINEFPGNGIGLATVKRIIRRHGGEIWGKGETGKGACFYFSLGAGSVQNGN